MAMMETTQTPPPPSPQITQASARVARPRMTKLLLGLLLLVGCFLFFIDFCAPFAASPLLFGSGLYLALFFSKSPPRSHVVTTALVLFVTPSMIVWRMMPIHSLDWSGIDRLEVEQITGEGHFEITDPVELKRFEQFGARGTLGTMIKSGYGYQILVWREN